MNLPLLLRCHSELGRVQRRGRPDAFVSLSKAPAFWALLPEIYCGSLRVMTSLPKREVWRIPLYTTLVATAVLLPLDIGWPDLSFLVNLLVVAPLLFLATIVFLLWVVLQTVRSRFNFTLTLSFLASLIGVFAVAAFFEFYGRAIRDDGRWLIWSREYKTQVLTQPAPPNGQLKHIKWDSYGMFAQDFDEFLAFDPTDSLTAPRERDPTGFASDIPSTFSVRRLESRWYLITYPF